MAKKQKQAPRPIGAHQGSDIGRGMTGGGIGGDVRTDMGHGRTYEGVAAGGSSGEDLALEGIRESRRQDARPTPDEVDRVPTRSGEHYHTQADEDARATP